MNQPGTSLSHNRLVNILKDYTSERIASFTDVSRLVDDLGIDSLELVAITMAIESEFGIVIPSDIMAGVPTVGDLTSFLDDRLAFKAKLEAEVAKVPADV